MFEKFDEDSFYSNEEMENQMRQYIRRVEDLKRNRIPEEKLFKGIYASTSLFSISALKQRHLKNVDNPL